MSWRKYLLIPQLSLYAVTAPRDQRRAWDRYWSGVRRTGADGEVLWDADADAEAAFTAARLRAHADLALPMVDLGCGNGRQARALTELGARVLGVDRSTAAIERACREATEAGTEVDFRVGDAAEPGLGQRVASEFGESNAHIRGVLHVIDPAARSIVVGNLSDLLGNRGTLYICESDAAGDPLDYLVKQGATPTRLPPAVRRLVAAGVRAPSHFGPDQVAEYFPPSRWRVLDSGPTVMYGVPLRPGGPRQEIPSFFAVLRVRR
jgi:SAM-dependent methyltransferase